MSHWFFIRYADPEPHLRFRFKLTALSQYASVLITCQDALADYIISGEVHRVLTDTYRRELERYGEQTIDQTERIFWRDSELVSDLLQLDGSESFLFQAALLGIDAYQTSFGLTQREKQRHCQHMYAALFAKHGASPDLQQALARQYRKNQLTVLRLLRQCEHKEESPVLQAILRHSQSIDSYVAEIMHTFSWYEPNTKFDYVSSIGHMFINRLFSVQQSHYELLVYHHLHRVHQSINVQLSNVV